jgi:hypothetical protein
MDSRIKVLKGSWSKEKTEKALGIISDFMERYQLKALGINKLHPSGRLENLLRLTNKIKESAKSKRLKVDLDNWMVAAAAVLALWLRGLS